MVTIDMVWTNTNTPDDKQHFRESFDNASQALYYLVGYIGGVPIIIDSLDMED
jgi:hypothetical protein